MAGDIIFKSRDLRARWTAGDDWRLLVVTFSSFHKDRTLDRPGFGEDFLRDEGVAAIHVVARTNRWFQYPELEELLATIRGVAARYKDVIAYGSSMGGFAALTYGADLGAGTAIAFSPQLSLDRRVAPFETRWRGEARRIRRWRAGRGALAQQVIAYDPRHAIDAAHAAAFAARAPTILIAVPHGGHPAGAALSQADLLKRLVRDVVAGTLDEGDYARILRERRWQSAQYLYTVARRLGAHHRGWRLRLAERALAIDPSPHNHVLMAACLEALGRKDEAESHHRAALERAPGDVDSRLAYADFLTRSGRRGAALAMRWRVWRARLSG